MRAPHEIFDGPHWKLSAKRAGKTYEIAAVMSNFQHGFESYGWVGPDKKHIIFMGLELYKNISPNHEQWGLMIGYAEKYIAALNDKLFPNRQ